MRTIESEAVNHPDFATLWIVPVFVIVESDLSPIAAEYGSISACSTQNKAKRANKIVFLLLIRDQEVDGSNPFAPTNLLESATYKMRKSIERLVQGQEVMKSSPVEKK